MMRALVIGASGQIGRALIPRLLTRGCQVLALSRTERTSSTHNLSWIQGDIFASVPALPAVDAIFSLGPLNGFSSWLMRAQLAGSPRIVAFGSMSVESKRDSTDPAERAIAETLRLAERELADAASVRNLVWTLLRPTLIYGGGLDKSLTPLARLGTRLHVFPRLRAATGLRQPVHVDDLADACIAAVSLEGACNRVFDLAGGERLSFSELLDRIRMSLPTRVLPVPVSLAVVRMLLAVMHLRPRWRGIGKTATERLQIDLIAGDEAARRLLHWSPREFRPDASTWLESPLP
jgi:nucleoside-diphosphate-sugar epimerase